VLGLFGAVDPGDAETSHMSPVRCPVCGSTDTVRDPDPRRAWRLCAVCGEDFSLLNVDFITGELPVIRRPAR
jgi:hypothetical protein